MFLKIWSFITKAFSHLVLISSTTCRCWKYALYIEKDIMCMHTYTHTHTFTHRHRHTLQANAWPSLENSRFIKMQGTFNQSFLFAFLLIIIKKNYSKYGMWTITYFLNVGLNYSPLFFFLHLGNRLNIAVQDMHSIFKVRFWFCLSKW